MIAPVAFWLIAPMVYSLIQLVTSWFINAIFGKRVTRAGKRQESRFLPLLALPIIMKVQGKGITRAGKEYDNTDDMNKNF